jgi:hypothetical protein
VENRRREIAAYRLDKYIGLDMIPLTVEKIFEKTPGSCQLWIESQMSLREKTARGIETPPDKAAAWVRATYLQQAFDSLIANEDRNKGNVLVTEDWRAILIDHSRTFRTGRKFRIRLINEDKDATASTVMLQLPRHFVDKIGGLSLEVLKSHPKYLVMPPYLFVLHFTQRDAAALSYYQFHLGGKPSYALLDC